MDAPDPGELGHANFLEFCREQTRCADGVVEEHDGVLLLAGPADELSALDLAARVDAGVAPADVVRTAVAFYGARRRGFMLYTRDDTEADIASAALSAGLVPLLQMPQMVCTQRPPDAKPVAGLDVHVATSPDDVDRFAGVVAAGYADAGLTRAETALRFRYPERWLAPHLTLFVGHLDGAPVAAGLTFMGSNAAGTYLLATVPEARGRGLGEALVTRMTQAGFDAGASLVGLQASRMGESIYRRIGYDGVYLYRGYYGGPPSS